MKTILHLGPNDAGARLSAEDFAAAEYQPPFIKRSEYHAIGVREYVIVDRFKQAVLVLTWQAGDFAERVLLPDATYVTPLLPGLSVRLADVFAAAG